MRFYADFLGPNHGKMFDILLWPIPVIAAIAMLPDHMMMLSHVI
jgi:hypothetical protein